MGSQTETFAIESCPLCGQVHRYRLVVERSLVVKMITVNDFSERSETTRRFVRIFTCPIKNEEFQGQIMLVESSYNPISEVEILGLSPEVE